MHCQGPLSPDGTAKALANRGAQRTVDYDAINHLNLLFSHPSTVSSISKLSSVLQSHQNALTREISALEASFTAPSASSTGAEHDEQVASPMSPMTRMRTAQAAQTELASIFTRISGVRSRAEATEASITAMTADIKRLDGTKRNLTLSMTALKRLQMLATAYEQLRVLARARQYRDASGLLQAVVQLMRHFAAYRGIDQVAALARGVADLQRELLEQVCEDFELAFTRADAGGLAPQRRQTLTEACAVMDALGDAARQRLVTWYVNTELREYRQVFRGSDEAGSLDNIGRRYAWFKRMMRVYDEEHASLFPVHWRVGESLAAAFCDGTRDDFKGILERSMRRTDAAGRLDVNLLLSCLQETLDFEQALERRFKADYPRASIDTLGSADERGGGASGHTFAGSISTAFEPYLSLWVDSQDRALAAMIPRYKTQPLVSEDDEFTPQAVIPSAIELFHFYKLTLSQCAKLSTGDRLLDLSRTFAKYLDEYAQQVLFGFLQRGGNQGPPLQDVVLVLNTADFWHTNTNQLEDSIRRRIDGELAPKVDLSAQSDAFMGVASAAVLALVHKVELELTGAWREMKNTNWSRMEQVGDQSSYVGELVRQINGKAEEVLGLVVKQQYARAFCDNLVEHIATAYLTNVVACKPVSEVGAEQMLLDKYVLTKALENLLSYHTKPPSAPAVAVAGAGAASTSSVQPSTPQQLPPPPPGFVKRVNQAMTRMDPLLKTLQVRPSPAEGLVQAYLIHIGDGNEQNFRKVLELKGLTRRADQAHLVEMFHIHRESFAARPGQRLVQSSPLLAGLMASGSSSSTTTGLGVVAMNPAAALLGASVVGSGSSSSAGGAGSSSTSGPSATLDAAAALGEKLMNAARDAGAAVAAGSSSSTAAAAATVTSVLAGAASSSSGSADAAGTASPAGSSATTSTGGTVDRATLNENLRNIGKFFRRDIGGLGARFGRRDVSSGGGGDDAGR